MLGYRTTKEQDAHRREISRDPNYGGANNNLEALISWHLTHSPLENNGRRSNVVHLMSDLLKGREKRREREKSCGGVFGNSSTRSHSRVTQTLHTRTHTHTHMRGRRRHAKSGQKLISQSEDADSHYYTAPSTVVQLEEEEPPSATLHIMTV